MPDHYIRLPKINGSGGGAVISVNGQTGVVVLDIDKIIEVNNFASLPVTGVIEKIYITKDNNKMFRWNVPSLSYVELSPGDESTIQNIPCDPSVIVGDAVRMSSGVAVKSQANNENNANFIGIVESKSSPVSANIRILGISLPIFSGLTENADYYLSDSVAGQLTTTPPSSPGSVVFRVGQAFSSSELIVVKGIRIVLT